jgi:thiol-disulfide isomerase/thioredoxin
LLGVAARRFPVIPVVLCTLLAVVSAAGVYLAFGGDDDGGADDPPGVDGAALPLQETGPLPASAAEVRLAPIGDGGDEAVLGDYLGERPVVVNFFASWCDPCYQEMPDFQAVSEALGDEVNFVGLNISETNVDRAVAMVEETGVTYPTFADPDGSGITFFGGTLMPTTVFIDAAGEVVSVESRQLDEAELRSRITELLGVPA